MPVIGTAGHVDHGKSTLVEALTGRDPDRWAEEKQRGLTIDLGFAWTTLPGGIDVSFIDVPGHERFLKNMLAGIEGIDVGLLVVAADEGWMPQSEEHLAVLDLLDVDRAVIAITKVDRVEDELADLAVAEVEERVAGTTLEGAPIVKVSATSGTGIEELLGELERALPAETRDQGRPRLWIDRSFAVAGAGTVVTGTLLGGALHREDGVVIYPDGLEGRIRSLQVHEQQVDEAFPGQRVAINLAGVDHTAIRRGDMVGLPDHWALSGRFSAQVRVARFADELEQRGAYQIHLGSSAQPVTLTGVEEQLAVLVLDHSLPLTVGDRFIIRDTGRKLVVAGGRVLDPKPGRTSVALQDGRRIDPDAGADEIATKLLEIRGVDELATLSMHSGGGTPVGYVGAGASAMDPGRLQSLSQRVAELVDEMHRTHPLRPGAPLATVAAELGVAREIVEQIVDGEGTLTRIGPDIARAGRSASLDAEQEQAWQRAIEILERDLSVPAESDLGITADLSAMKQREGELVRVGPGLVYLKNQIDQIIGIITSFDDEFTVADFRDAAGLSRKYAVPILEWADKEGLTVRRGDYRRKR